MQRLQPTGEGQRDVLVRELLRVTHDAVTLPQGVLRGWQAQQTVPQACLTRWQQTLQALETTGVTLQIPLGELYDVYKRHGMLAACFLRCPDP